jgi:hypothetical protein
MHFKTLAILASIIATIGCATPTTPRASGVDDSNRAGAPIPAYLTAKQSCAVVVGGGGSHFDDPRAAGFWHAANRQITGYLHEILTHEGYQVVQLILPPNESRETAERVVAESLAQNQCNRIIQVAHLLGEDSNGKYFQFSVSLQHVEPHKDQSATTAGISSVTVGDYNRDYRFPRTQEAFDSFHTGAFANEAYLGLNMSGALKAILRDDANSVRGATR